MTSSHFQETTTKLSGRCYCGDIQYKFDGEVQGALQCHCRECQYITGGNPNVVMVAPESGLKITQGQPSVLKPRLGPRRPPCSVDGRIRWPLPRCLAVPGR